MDAIDLRILTELQLNSRLTNQELADRVGLSPSPCLRRVRALESQGVIAGYTAVLNPKAIGLDITAFVRLRLNSHAQADVELVEERIRAIEHVVEAHLLAGDYDYQLKVVIGGLDEYEELLKKHIRDIPMLGSIETTFAFGATKPLTALPTTRQRATLT